jgi:type-F conjugative transfer system pilin assembly protein TrbC
MEEKKLLRILIIISITIYVSRFINAVDDNGIWFKLKSYTHDLISQEDNIMNSKDEESDIHKKKSIKDITKNPNQHNINGLKKIIKKRNRPISKQQKEFKTEMKPILDKQIKFDKLAKEFGNNASGKQFDIINALDKAELAFETSKDTNYEEYNELLRIFVSSSMPINTLKAYALEAEKYNGILVFNGLPDGSFKKLINIINQISSGDVNAAFQIDNTAFEEFNVQNVPTIILNKNKKHDSVTGNITLKAALDLFSRDGDLKMKAKMRLRDAK